MRKKKKPKNVIHTNGHAGLLCLRRDEMGAEYFEIGSRQFGFEDSFVDKYGYEIKIRIN